MLDIIGKIRHFVVYLDNFINKHSKLCKVVGWLKRGAHFLFNILQVILIVYLFMEFGTKGIVWLIFVSLFIVVVIRWKAFKAIIWHMFRLIWGKYPEEFKKGELKMTKLKFVGFKKNGKSNTRKH